MYVSFILHGTFINFLPLIFRNPDQIASWRSPFYSGSTLAAILSLPLIHLNMPSHPKNLIKLMHVNNKRCRPDVYPSSLICYMHLYRSQACFMQNFNIITSRCSRAGWFGLTYKPQRLVFSCLGPNEINRNCRPGNRCSNNVHFQLTQAIFN